MGKLAADLEKNTINIKNLMDSSSDLTMKFGKAGGRKICIVFCEGLASTDTTADLIYRPLNSIGNEKEIPFKRLVEMVQDELLLAGEQVTVKDYDQLAQRIMSGFVIILIDGLDYGIGVGVQGYQARGIEEPSTHINLRGSREGFVEVIRTNISMVRRRMKTPDLVFNIQTIGHRSHTDICVCYLRDKVDKKLLAEVQKRIDGIELNTILESGYIQPFLEQKGDILFSEVGVTERPDTFAAKLYDGRVGILVDGTPFALFVPHLFVENFSTIDDYTGKPLPATIFRLLRYFAFVCSVLLPGFYVALANFNPELFPNSLLLNLTASIQKTPYPLLVECLIIHIFYEIMREAGLRLPQNIGHAVSVVGGLVIGDIVVSAGLVGAPLLLIVAISAITCFVVPDLYESIAVMRFAFIMAGGMWGIFGLTVVGMFFIIKVCSMSSYGIPHLAPVAPFTFKAMRDVFIHAGWRTLAKSDMEIQKMNGVTIDHDN